MGSTTGGGGGGTKGSLLLSHTKCIISKTKAKTDEGLDQTSQGRTRQGKARSGKRRKDNTRQGKVREVKTTQDKTRRDDGVRDGQEERRQLLVRSQIKYHETRQARRETGQN